GPDLYSMQFPAAIFHTFISDIRVRINKGLRIAEEAIESSKTADNIRRIRNEYRAAMRSGIIDSVEDLDVVLLAKEIGGTILSADEGILNMADSLGIEVFSSKDFIIKFGAAEGS
ncbi:MAG TPA: RNA ligase partner protein, partial [Spirochaetota bacterium]|nr:RNA ligase partner protein [Spirochaetota bacterium]